MGTIRYVDTNMLRALQDFKTYREFSEPPVPNTFEEFVAYLEEGAHQGETRPINYPRALLDARLLGAYFFGQEVAWATQLPSDVEEEANQ